MHVLGPLLALFCVHSVNGLLYFGMNIPNRVRSYTGFSLARSSHRPLAVGNRVDSSSKLLFRVQDDDDLDGDGEVIEFDRLDRAGIMEKATKAVVPLAATLGFAAAPSSSIVVRGAAAAAGGFVGLKAREYLESRFGIDTGVPEEEEDEDDPSQGGDDFGSGRGPSPKVAKFMKRLISSGPPLSDLTNSRLQKACKKAGIPSQELGEVYTRTFAELVYQAATEPSMDLTELSHVVDFAKEMQLSESEVGDGFALASIQLSKEIGRDERGFFDAFAPMSILESASKIFFLADKLLESKWNSFYGKRVSISLYYYTPESFSEIITEASQQLFTRCVDSVLSRPDDFTLEEVNSLRDFLSTDARVSELRPSNMAMIVSDALQGRLDTTLGGCTSMDADVSADYDSLVKSQAILGWNTIEFSRTLEKETMPLFEEAAKSLIESLHDDPSRVDELGASLLGRVDSLKVDPRKARIVLTNIISDKNYEYMSTLNRVYNVSDGNIEPTFKIMTAYAAYHDALEKMVAKVMDGITIPIPGLPLADMVRVSMYEMNLKSAKISADKDAMFELNEEQTRIVKRNMVMPKIIEWVKQCIDERNVNADASAAYTKLLQTNDISKEDWAATAVDFYYVEALKVSNMRAVPSVEDMAFLADLRAFLGTDKTMVNNVNLELFGDKYVKALSEAMMPSGIITEEYEDGLARLRDRLDLDEESAASLLAVAARERLVPVIKNLAEVWKSDVASGGRKEGTKEYQERQRRKAQDPISSLDNVLGYMEDFGAQKSGGGPNVFMREALNLVDFFNENYFKRQRAAAAASNGGDQDAFLPLVTALPVSAFGAVENEDLVGVIKHYMMTRLAESDEGLRQRYMDEERYFAAILGFDGESLDRLKEAVAYNAFKNILANVFATRSTLQPQEFTQLALLVERLQFSTEKDDYFESLLKRAARAVLLKSGTQLFKRERPPTAADAERVRSQIESAGLCMIDDMGFNDRLRAYLFTLEVQELIENEQSMDLLDLQEAYNIPIERAEEIIEATCRRYVGQLLNLALRAAKKYDEPGAVRYVNQINRYIDFVDGTVDADGNIFKASDKDRLVSFFENDRNSDSNSDTEDTKEKCYRLRTCINLTDDYKAPIDGIDGLLVEGKLKNAQEMHDEGKGRRWAWG